MKRLAAHLVRLGLVYLGTVALLDAGGGAARAGTAAGPMAPLAAAERQRPGIVPLEQGHDGVEPLRVITHTREYCDQLSARAVELRRLRATPLAQAELLAIEGDRLCAQGQIRPGIMRLRRAIMLLRGQGSPAQ